MNGIKYIANIFNKEHPLFTAVKIVAGAVPGGDVNTLYRDAREEASASLSGDMLPHREFPVG
ncbi:hypothetical protein OI69_05520 [Pectobacterium fontis]|uniref:Uncharacterized protein n=1 Tax=Pectobacterium fontis TaxID=2558042 RepID=A0A7V8L624_9GAMM|nr:hypothetical protein OI69_05520 [Pectobacterium fontis]